MPEIWSTTRIVDDPTNGIDDRIMKYIHKKFDNIDKKESKPTQHSIKKITIYNKSEPEKDPQCQTEGHSSVINYQPMRYKLLFVVERIVSDFLISAGSLSLSEGSQLSLR